MSRGRDANAAGSPPTLGLFEKRIEGDDSLLELARLRFQQAGMDAEMYAGAPDQLDAVLRFRPSPDSTVVVHLARDFNLAEEESRRRIVDFAARFAGRVYGLVLHDHPDMASRPADFIQAAQNLESRLGPIDSCPMVFIEYAAGLAPMVFARFFESIRDLGRISACLDIGHIGIQQARHAYAQIYPGEDICAVKTQSARLQQVLPDLLGVVNSTPEAVLGWIEVLGQFGKPVHFHLHDAHPLSTFSPFGVSDHLSFLTKILLAFEYRGRRSVPLMYGPAGLSRVVATALRTIGPSLVSFNLEIHPTPDRLALADAARLFGHWRDKTNAEQMNHWLSVLSQNHRLLREAIQAASEKRG